jgi:hypothetical protein
MKVGLKFVSIALLSSVALTMSTSARSDGPTLPDGWTFYCNGTTGVYLGPNGSIIEQTNSRYCTKTKNTGMGN